MTKLKSDVRTTLMAVALSATASAFSAAADAADESPGGPAASQSASSGAVTLEEVVVTAGKRSEEIESVPSSVTAIGSGLIGRVQAGSLSDVAAYVPGLNVQPAGVDANRLIVRGLSTGPNDLSPSVGVYVDDAPFGSNSGFALGALFSPDVDPFDLERVEVLRGPQGTLYGASTLAGLVKYVTKAPDAATFSTHARLDFGRADDSGMNSYATRAGANIPLVTDKVALRVSGFYSHADGDLTDVRTGQSDLNAVSKHGGRADLLIKPVDALSIDLIAFTDSSSTPHSGQIDGNAQTLLPNSGQYSGYNYVIGNLSSNYSVYEGTVRYEFSDGMTATSTSSYSRFAVSELADDTSTFQPALGALGSLLEFPGAVAPTTSKYTQELRLASASNGHFEWLGGLFFDRENSNYFSTVNSTYLFGATPPPALAPTVAAFANYESVDTIEHYTEYAGFADATYYLTPEFDLSAGLRFSHNSQQRASNSTGLLVLAGVLAPHAAATSGDGVWTESLAASWHLQDQSMVYARYATGYRPGGPNTRGGSFDPDTTRNYEVGFKTAGLGGVLRADIAAFLIDWHQIQLNFFDGTNTIIGNAGNARSKGVELQTTYAPVKAFTLQANAAYTDASISSLNPGAQGGAAVGDPLPGNSKWTASLLADYYVPVTGATEWNAGAGLRYRSSFNTTFPGDTGTRFYTLPATLFFDLRTGISFKDRIALNLQVLNVANQRKVLAAGEYLAVSQVDADAAGQPVYLGYTPGRTFGLSLTAQF